MLKKSKSNQYTNDKESKINTRMFINLVGTVARFPSASSNLAFQLLCSGECLKWSSLTGLWSITFLTFCLSCTTDSCNGSLRFHNFQLATSECIQFPHAACPLPNQSKCLYCSRNVRLRSTCHKCILRLWAELPFSVRFMSLWIWRIMNRLKVCIYGRKFAGRRSGGLGGRRNSWSSKRWGWILTRSVRTPFVSWNRRTNFPVVSLFRNSTFATYSEQRFSQMPTPFRPDLRSLKWNLGWLFRAFTTNLWQL